jgi:hypothetical protein
MGTTFIVVVTVVLLHFIVGIGFLIYKLGKKK